MVEGWLTEASLLLNGWPSLNGFASYDQKELLKMAFTIVTAPTIVGVVELLS
jgi:hypothetical protein|tara:strand:- start:1539 stop:1694 length:156 start_codon:yes stop_codon:yes gene_type:complete